MVQGLDFVHTEHEDYAGGQDVCGGFCRLQGPD